jgi:P pilus assembly chaperone PapD
MRNQKNITPPPEDGNRRWGFLFLLALFLTLAGSALANVLVAPTVVFVDDKSRTGRMEIHNPSQLPREVTIHFAYGLPTSDSLGNVSVVIQDTGVVDPRSAMDWIKAFPKRLVIAPGATQVVRLVANPPAGLKDGEYWARIVVRSQEGETKIPVASTEGAISTKLNMIMQTAIMLKYRKGAVTSQLELKGAQATATDSLVTVTVSLASTGSASYVGTLAIRVLDASKKELAQQRSDLAVYRELKRRVDIPIGKAAGKKPYQVEVSISTDGRSDIMQADMIPGNKIQYTLSVE